ncbi:6-phosphogluconolactonase [Acetobacteraceae bacterium ESL0697]|nr:6-phosphogluconolactonase [Acetobacteraceae bacterium ESL0697]
MQHASSHVFDNAGMVAVIMADWFIRVVRDCKEPKVRIALSGGSTPRQLFEILAQPSAAKEIDWSRVEIFYGDERHVPYDNPDSNHKMAMETLLSKVPLPPAQIHPIPVSGKVEDDAASYQETLQKAYGSDVLLPGKPLFELVMLGLGADGHTASLFPGQDVLNDQKDWVGVARPDTVPHERITLTYPAIASSRLIVFLVTGDSKVWMLRRLMAGDETIPSGRITSEGDIVILADRDAAGES